MVRQNKKNRFYQMGFRFIQVSLFFVLWLCPSYDLLAKKSANKNSKLSFSKGKAKIRTDKDWSSAKKKTRSESRKNIKKEHASTAHLDDLAKDKKSLSGLEKLLSQEIMQMQIIIKKTKNKNILGDLWLRLAKRYLEKAKLISQQQEIIYEEKLALHERGKGPRPKRPNKKRIRSYIKKTVQLGKKYVKNFPKGRLLDRAYFLLGSSNFELGYKAVGNDYYARLVKQFPKGKFIAEAYFFRAEYYFDIRMWDKAGEMYRKSLKMATTESLKHLSTYKLAWCYFYEGRSLAAFSTMQRLIKTTTKGKVSYYEEALKDLVLFYTESKGAKQAPRFFERFGGKKASFYLETLAKFYYDKGRSSDSEMIFNYLIRKKPLSFKAEAYQYHIVWGKVVLAAPIHRVGLVIEKWLGKYGANSQWFRRQKRQSKFPTVRKRQEQVIRNYILEKHLAYNNIKELSVKSSRENLKAYLPKLYAMYIKDFKADHQEDPKYISVRFFYGEILYDLGLYKEAAKEYLWVSQHSQHPRASMAGMNALLCAERSLPSEQTLLAQRKGRTKPIRFSPEVLYFISSGTQFIKAFPKNKSNDQIYFKIAFLHEVFNRLEKAEKWFRLVIDKYPRGKYAFRSMEAVINIYNIRKDYKGLQKVAGEFSQMKNVSFLKGRKNAFHDLYLQSSFELARSAEKSSNYLKSAEQFESIYNRQKGSKNALALSSLFNSAINYQKAKRVKKAIFMHKILAKAKRGDRVLKAKSQKELGQLYQRVGRYDFAARAFSASARMYPQKEKQVVASLHFNAATLYLALNREKRALYHYKSYLALSSDPERFQSLFLMAEVSEKQRLFSEAVSFYRRYLEDVTLSSDRRGEVFYRLSEIYKKQGKAREASYWIRRLEGVGKTATGDELKVIQGYLSKIRLARLNSKLRNFYQLRVPADSKVQQKVGRQKQTFMEDLKQELTFIVQHGDGEALLKALNILGKINENMVQFLLEAPKPKELQGEELAEYVKGIQKLAVPYQKEATKSYELLVKKAVAGDFYGPEYERALAKTRKENKNISVYGSYGLKNSRSDLIDWMD